MPDPVSPTTSSSTLRYDLSQDSELQAQSEENTPENRSLHGDKFGEPKGVKNVSTTPPLLPSLPTYAALAVRLDPPKNSGLGATGGPTGGSPSSTPGIADFVYAEGLINITSDSNSAQNALNLANSLAAYREELFQNAQNNLMNSAEQAAEAAADQKAADAANTACLVITLVIAVALLVVPGVGEAADAALLGGEAAMEGAELGMEGGIEMTEMGGEMGGEMSEGVEGMEGAEGSEGTEGTEENEPTEETQENNENLEANNENMEANESQLEQRMRNFKRFLAMSQAAQSIITGAFNIVIAKHTEEAQKDAAQASYYESLASTMNTVEHGLENSINGYLKGTSDSLKESVATLSGLVSATSSLSAARSPVA
jgi:hypothetical protein